MFCRNCGTENADNVPTCISCGATLTNPFQASSAPAGGWMPSNKPENYLVQSILVTLCCCLPFGIVSIVYAARVDSLWRAGDFQGAVTASENAKKWSWIAFGLGLVANIIFVGLQFLGATMVDNPAGPGN